VVLDTKIVVDSPELDLGSAALILLFKQLEVVESYILSVLRLY
jgi:hypothetical protein